MNDRSNPLGLMFVGQIIASWLEHVERQHPELIVDIVGGQALARG